jgi:NAD(P)-dependent dehydrogenase (short-subunit alcohol dehydrogenase family)
MTVRQLFGLDGRVALITGGSRGLGLQIALCLGEMGAQIALSARKSGELVEARELLRAKGIDVLTVVNDLSQPENALDLTKTVAAHFGRIDILVNNAGTTWGAPAEEYPLAAWNKVLTLNTTSVFALSQAVANRCFLPQRSGNIIMIASAAGLRVRSGMNTVAYSTSKAAVLHLMRSLAVEWGPHQIRVNAICPGFFPTKLSKGLLERIAPTVIERTPLGRLGNDTDLMGAAVYLASDASRHVTGQYIAVDGGASI